MVLPRYIEAYKTGVLQEKARIAGRMLEECFICPRKCGVDRSNNTRGYCRTGSLAVVCSSFAHNGEEPPVSGSQGSGTIFFSRCNMACVYCQNHSFSQEEEGREVGIEELSKIMLDLENAGCHNINFVTPTHVMPQILQSLFLAVKKGLSIPLVYNTSGYELPQTIKFLDGIIDVYLTDMRYAENSLSIQFSDAPNYVENNKESVKEMFRQVGNVEIDKNGVIIKGLIIRHLVLPENISSSEKILTFIADELSKETYISLMSQYFPAYKAPKIPPLNRRILFEEYEKVKKILQRLGLENGWIQEGGGLERLAGTNIKRNV